MAASLLDLTGSIIDPLSKEVSERLLHEVSKPTNKSGWYREK